MRARLLVVLSFVLFGCEARPPTAVVLVVSADDAVRSELSSLRIRVLGGPDAVTQTPSFDETRDVAALSWPVTLTLVPEGDDASRVFRAEVSALDGTGGALVHATVASSFVPGETRVLALRLEASCLRVDCGEGESCADGVCAPVLVIDPSTLPPLDGGAPDAGTPMDGGTVDAGPLDAASDGGRDAGGSDADPGDAGPPPAAPALRWPVNGAYTGSVHVPLTGEGVDHPLRPRLMWEAVAGATSYRVQLDDCGAEPFETCSFPSPEVDDRTAAEPAPSGTALQYRPSAALAVSTTAPVGRRYVWRVAACHAAGCGSFSPPRYLYAGRHEDDFNGDGYADLVVGAYQQSSPEAAEGNAFVYYGGAGGLGADPSPDVVLDNPADQADGYFGYSVASAGDLNGDGYADLVVGAYGQTSPENSEGNAFVYYGGAGGLGADPTPDVVLDSPADQPAGYFGHSVASAGDVNGDGYADLVVGGYRQDRAEADEGNAFVYYGGAGGLGADPSPDVVLDNPADQAGGYFGHSVASAGDVDGDGYADLVVGAYRQGSPEAGEGNAFVYYGGEGGLGADPSPDVVLDNPADHAYGQFGRSVASAGDLNGDGFADLVIGAYDQDSPETDEGNAFVYHGAAGGLGTDPSPDVVLDNPADQASGLFGFSVASAGDVDGRPLRRPRTTLWALATTAPEARAPVELAARWPPAQRRHFHRSSRALRAVSPG